MFLRKSLIKPLINETFETQIYIFIPKETINTPMVLNTIDAELPFKVNYILSTLSSYWLYTINVKTAEPIGPKGIESLSQTLNL